MRFFDFLDEIDKIPAKIHIQLLDLARGLTRNANLELEFGSHSLYDESRFRITVSTFGEDYSESEQLTCMKRDVYLRAIGSAWFSDVNETRLFLNHTHQYPNLARQLFALCEDTRLERICRKIRPGTAKAFTNRHILYENYVAKQKDFHHQSHHIADVLLLTLYQRMADKLNHEEGTTGKLPLHLEFVNASMDSLISSVMNASSTSEIGRTCNQFLQEVSLHLPHDVIASYFMTNEYNGSQNPFERADSYNDMVRTNKLENNEQDTVSIAKNANETNEQTETWHRETKDEAGNLLQMNLEHGNSSNKVSDKWREGSDEEALVSEVMQGPSQSKENRDCANDAMPTSRTSEFTGSKNVIPMIQTALVRHRFLPRKDASLADVQTYSSLVNQVTSLKSRLIRMVEANLEHKQTQKRENLLAGRLSKKVIRMIVDPTPRMFYKKESPIHELDAAFMLLVDCSGSMFDKMDETRLCVTLFHETLKSLRIPHTVTGFWEDTDAVGLDASITFFQQVIDFNESMKISVGPAICQLDSHLDNRDGYAIRTMSSQLLLRPERRKFLIVFSDGEPSAMNYEESGVYDTHQAVLQARRQRISVVNIFFTDTEDSSFVKNTIHDIYGLGAVTIPHVDAILDVFAPVLRKLLATVEILR